MSRSALASLVALTLACGAPEEATESNDQETPTGVTIYDPATAFNGFTLGLEHGRTPILMDMAGRVVHSWPDANVRSRVRLLSDCSILGIGTGRELVQYGWTGDEVWRADLGDELPHHDFARLENGNTLLLTLPGGAEADDVVELDRVGRVVWRWYAGEPLAGFIDSGPKRYTGDTTHLNSIQELPDNPWFRAGDVRFRPGNLLLSARNLNLLLIVDRQSGEVVWTYRDELDLQHEARMLPPDDPRAGHIQFFNNRYGSFQGDRQSHVVEIDPRSGEVVWRYAAPELFSGTSSAQQALPNGNVLIASSRGPRAFEVTRAGRTVWQWEPPHGLNRPERYAPDHCPELAALGPAEGTGIEPPAGYRFVDREAYRFSRRNHRTERMIDGVKRTLIKPARSCSTVLPPDRAAIELEYGIDRRQLRASRLESYTARFALERRDPGSGETTVLFEDAIDAEGPYWRTAAVDLSDWAYRRQELCLRLSEEGLEDGQVGLAAWGAPLLSSGRDRALRELEREAEQLTPEELEVRREHLRAMGYVN